MKLTNITYHEVKELVLILAIMTGTILLTISFV